MSCPRFPYRSGLKHKSNLASTAFDGRSEFEVKQIVVCFPFRTGFVWVRGCGTIFDKKLAESLSVDEHLDFVRVYAYAPDDLSRELTNLAGSLCLPCCKYVARRSDKLLYCLWPIFQNPHLIRNLVVGLQERSQS